MTPVPSAVEASAVPPGERGGDTSSVHIGFL